MKVFFSTVSMLLHLFWITLFGYFFLAKHSLQASDSRYVNYINSSFNCPVCEKASDIIGYADQLGRLDLISILLAYFGVLLAVVAFAGFWMFKREAITIAEREAKNEVRDVAPDIITKYLTDGNHKVLNDLIMNNMPSIYAIVDTWQERMDQGEGNLEEIIRGLDPDPAPQE